MDSLDPQQTTLPDGWKKLPCYAVHAGNTVKLSVQRLGDSQPLPDELRLDRQIFLDFDGQGFTASDRITGTLHRAWRIEASAPTELGRVSIAGKDQLVTIGKESGRAGVELRQGLLKLSADSRIPFAAEISAVGWNADFHEVRAVLHLPGANAAGFPGGVEAQPRRARLGVGFTGPGLAVVGFGMAVTSRKSSTSSVSSGSVGD